MRYSQINLVRTFLFVAGCVLFPAASTALADTATTVFCSFPGQAAVTSSSTCAVAGPSDLSGYSGVQASSLLDFSLGDSASDFAELHVTQSAMARAPLGTPYYGALPLTVSSASLTDFVLSTAGQERTGFVEILYSPVVTIAPEGIGGNYSLSLGNLPAINCDLVGVASANTCQEYAVDLPGRLYQFTLGTQFALNYTGLVTAYGSPDNNFASGYADIAYRFRFLEADGSTPAMLTIVTPEPATWTVFLLAIGVGILVWLVRRAKLTKLS